MCSKSITVIPPKILEYYSHILLNNPIKFRDDLEKIWNMYLYVKKILYKKVKNKIKLEELDKEFLEIYERAKKKEKDINTKTENKTKMPFYFITMPNKGDQNIFDRLRYKHL